MVITVGRLNNFFDFGLGTALLALLAALNIPLIQRENLELYSFYKKTKQDFQ